MHLGGDSPLVALLLVGAIIALGMAFLNVLFPRGRSELLFRPHQVPLDMLQQRYARGEISHEEYETLRHELEHH